MRLPLSSKPSGRPSTCLSSWLGPGWPVTLPLSSNPSCRPTILLVWPADRGLGGPWDSFYHQNPQVGQPSPVWSADMGLGGLWDSPHQQNPQVDQPSPVWSADMGLGGLWDSPHHQHPQVCQPSPVWSADRGQWHYPYHQNPHVGHHTPVWALGFVPGWPMRHPLSSEPSGSQAISVSAHDRGSGWLKGAQAWPNRVLIFLHKSNLYG